MIKYALGVSNELADIAAYLAQYNETTAERFLEDPELASIRMSLVKGFDDYLIFYVQLVNGVRILHVIHSAPDYNRIVDIDDL